MNSFRKTVLVLAAAFIMTGVASATFYQLSFRGLQTGQSAVDAGENLDFSTNIVNTGDNPRTDIRVEASLVSGSDRSVVFKRVVNDDVDLAGREVLGVGETLEIPENVPTGDYSLMLQAVDSSGATKAFISRDIRVENSRSVPDVSLGNKGVYIVAERIEVGDDYIRRYEQPSYGTQGANVLAGVNFTVEFKMENTGSETVSPTADFTVSPTYSEGETVKQFSKDLGTLAPGESREYSFPLKLSEPGTYDLNADIMDEGLNLGSGQVRVVIAGKDGSITDVSNSQDVYSSSEAVQASATVVGPAGGSTTVENAELDMKVLKQGSEIASASRTIAELPRTPKDYSLTVSPGQDLERYTLKFILRNNGEVYDTYSAEYQPLEAERKLTESGMIKEEGECFDNNVCTEEEFELGNCYDCINVSRSKFEDRKDERPETGEGPGLIVYLLLAGVVFMLGAVGYRRWLR
ncbi:MAG: hypothetical protein ABEJ93_03745 [Candidatus Nanohalobium sp.]